MGHSRPSKWANPDYQTQCNAYAHEVCVSYHFRRETEERWHGWMRALAGGHVVVAFEVEDGRTDAWDVYLQRLRRRAWGISLLTGAMGALIPTGDGVRLTWVVPRENVHDLGTLGRNWAALVGRLGGNNPRVQLVDVEPGYSAMDVLIELRCQAEQAVPILVGRGVIPSEAGLEILGARYDRSRLLRGLGVEPDLPHVNGVTSTPGSESGGLHDMPDHPLPGAGEMAVPTSREPGVEDVAAEIGPSGDIRPQLVFNGQAGTLGPGGVDAGDEWHGTGNAGSGWEPCRICTDPLCRQRRVFDSSSLHFTAVRGALRRGDLIPGPGGAFLQVQSSPPG